MTFDCRQLLKVLVKLFTKACGVKGQSPLSPVATGEILFLTKAQESC